MHFLFKQFLHITKNFLNHFTFNHKLYTYTDIIKWEIYLSELEKVNKDKADKELKKAYKAIKSGDLDTALDFKYLDCIKNLSF